MGGVQFVGCSSWFLLTKVIRPPVPGPSETALVREHTLSALGSAGALVQVVRIGHSGAKATGSDRTAGG